MNEELRKLTGCIRPADRKLSEVCACRFDSIAKPLHGLGVFEDLISRIGAAQENVSVDIRRKALVVFCSDNGVVAEGVTQCGSSVTLDIAGSLARKTSSVCIMAASAGADVSVIDVGMNADVEGVRAEKESFGTGNISKGPAMSRETAEKLILTGARIIRELKEAGYGIAALGEAGIGNTTTAAAVCAALTGMDARTVTGKGSGLSDAGLERKIRAVESALEVNRPDPEDPVDVLAKVGGCDIAAMTGAYLAAAAFHLPVVMDGMISAAAAYCAYRISRDTADYIIPSHMSREPAMKVLCDAMNLQPVIFADMHLGEGTGAVAMFPLLDLTAAVYHDAAKFGDIGVEQYVDQNGPGVF